MQPITLFRRLAALSYDGLFIVAVLFIAAQWFPLIPEAMRTQAWLQPLQLAYLYGCGFAFLSYFWRRKETIGLRAWRAQIVQSDGDTAINWRQSFIRYNTAAVIWLPCLYATAFTYAPNADQYPFISTLAVILWLLPLLTYGMALVGPRRKVLIDLVSKTRVLQHAKADKK